jgi:hypothetical protein
MQGALCGVRDVGINVSEIWAFLIWQIESGHINIPRWTFYWNIPTIKPESLILLATTIRLSTFTVLAPARDKSASS